MFERMSFYGQSCLQGQLRKGLSYPSALPGGLILHCPLLKVVRLQQYKFWPYSQKLILCGLYSKIKHLQREQTFFSQQVFQLLSKS